jgi:hypothetical protein
MTAWNSVAPASVLVEAYFAVRSYWHWRAALAGHGNSGTHALQWPAC